MDGNGEQCCQGQIDRFNGDCSLLDDSDKNLCVIMEFSFDKSCTTLVREIENCSNKTATTKADSRSPGLSCDVYATTSWTHQLSSIAMPKFTRRSTIPVWAIVAFLTTFIVYLLVTNFRMSPWRGRRTLTTTAFPNRWEFEFNKTTRNMKVMSHSDTVAKPNVTRYKDNDVKASMRNVASKHFINI